MLRKPKTQKHHDGHKASHTVNTSRTYRNDPCPCGKSVITEYKDSVGNVFKIEQKPVKFKKCCLNEMGDQLSMIAPYVWKRQHGVKPFRRKARI